MARAIIRYSLSNDNNGINGSEVRNILAGNRFEQIGAESFEADDIPVGDLMNVLARAVQKMQELRGNTQLDHLMIYLDRPSEEPDLYT